MAYLNQNNERKIQYSICSKLRIRNQSLREFLAELFGTCLFLLFGLGACAQYKFSKTDNASDSTSVLSINLAFGLGVTSSVLVFGKISGKILGIWIT